MDDAELFERQHTSLHAFYRLMASTSGGRLTETDGVTACIVPATPDRSVCNGVVYDRSDSLVGVLDRLCDDYERAGVQAWTVWVPAGDEEVSSELASRGHSFDAEPRAMAFPLASFQRPGSDDIEIESPGAAADAGRINDIAYGYDGDFTRALAGLQPGAAHVYVARLEGEAVGSTIAIDCERDCCITLVATLPKARGRGIATALIARALNDARERGCETTSLQATKAGRPVYERLGYRDLGPYQMWERRVAPI